MFDKVFFKDQVIKIWKQDLNSWVNTMHILSFEIDEL